MADLLVRHIPLPLPRPVMEETVEGAKNVKMNWLEEIPLPEMPELDLSWPKVGTEWLLQPWYEWKRFTEMNIYDFGNDWVELFLLVGTAVGIGLIALLILEGLFKGIEYLTRSRRKK